MIRVLMMHPGGGSEQVEVPAHTLQCTPQLAVLELEVFAPEVEELLHLLLRELTLRD